MARRGLSGGRGPQRPTRGHRWLQGGVFTLSCLGGSSPPPSQEQFPCASYPRLPPRPGLTPTSQHVPTRSPEATKQGAALRPQRQTAGHTPAPPSPRQTSGDGGAGFMTLWKTHEFRASTAAGPTGSSRGTHPGRQRSPGHELGDTARAPSLNHWATTQAWGHTVDTFSELLGHHPFLGQEIDLVVQDQTRSLAFFLNKIKPNRIGEGGVT